MSSYQFNALTGQFDLVGLTFPDLASPPALTALGSSGLPFDSIYLAATSGGTGLYWDGTDGFSKGLIVRGTTGVDRGYMITNDAIATADGHVIAGITVWDTNYGGAYIVGEQGSSTPASNFSNGVVIEANMSPLNTDTAAIYLTAKRDGTALSGTEEILAISNNYGTDIVGVFADNSVHVLGAITASGFILSGGGTLATQAYVNAQGFVTASSVSVFTNKSGNISQWTNNSGYLTSAVTSLSGTANQITASASTGAVTLSIPTNPIFSGTALTFPGALSIASGKTLTANVSLTIAGSDVTMTTPATSFTAARTDAANTFIGHQTIEGVTSTGATGTGNFVFSASPTTTGTFTAGNIIFANGGFIANPSNGTIYISSGPLFKFLNPAETAGFFLTGNGSDTATMQMGANVNGAAVNQTIQAANGITGTDKTGGNFTFASGKGTGAGTVSTLIFQTPTVGSTGTTAQSLATRLTLDSAGVKCSVPLWLSNAATTSLTPGVLAASTNASIVIYDSGGQAYRIPCII